MRRKGDKMPRKDRKPDPRIDWLRAVRAGDIESAHVALVEMQRDPERWFCSGVDEDGIPRVYGRRSTEAEARANALAGAKGYISEMAKTRVRAPVTAWQFTTYAPDQELKLK
jgi:hypothetical protein